MKSKPRAYQVNCVILAFVMIRLASYINCTISPTLVMASGLIMASVLEEGKGVIVEMVDSVWKQTNQL